MKKILSFVLVLAMVLGSVSMAFAANNASFPDVKGDESYAEAANVLKAVGVLEGYTNGEFRASNNITRAEAVKLVVVAMGLPVKEGNAYKTVFEDVPETAWYSGYVYWATTLGITEGTTPTTFRPDQMVTYDQMITFAMRALGYNDNLPGGYPAGYVFKAYTLAQKEGKDVYDHVPTGSAPATRGDCAEIVYAIMDQEFVQYSKDVNDFAVRRDDNDRSQTPFERLGCTVGVVTKESAHDSELIDNEKISSENTLVDLAPYIGAEVVLIRKDDKIVGIGEVTTTFVEGYKSDKNTIGGYKLADKVKNTDGEGFLNGFEKALTEDQLKNATYAVKFENGKISEVVSALAWEITEAGIMDKDFLADLNLGNKDESGDYSILTQPLTTNDKKEIVKTFELVGVKSLEDIAVDNVIYVYVGHDNENDKDVVTKIEVGTQVVEGRLSAANKDQNKYTIAGTVYNIAENDEAMEGDDLVAIRGNAITAYLDVDGKIYFAKKASEKTESAYAVLLGVDEPGDSAASSKATSAGRSNGQAEIFTADGETKIIAFAADTYDETIAAIKAGSLVEVTYNKSGKISGIEKVGEAIDSVTVSKKGVVDAGTKKGALPSDAVIFVFNGDSAKTSDLKDGSKYEIVSAAKVYGQKIEDGVTYIYNTKSGNFSALLTGSLVETKTVVALFTDWGYGDGSKLYDVTVFEGGEKKDYTLKADSDADVKGYLELTSNGASFYELVFEDDTIASAVPYDKFAVTMEVPVPEYSKENRVRTSVSGSILVSGAEHFELADDAVVYIYTPDGKGGGTWSLSKSTSKLAGLNDTNTASITLYDTSNKADYVFEIAVVILAEEE